MSTIVKFNNKVLRLNNKTVGWTAPPDPYNPLDLPANTIRVRTNDGNAPRKSNIDGTSYDTATLVDGTTDIYDVYKSGDSFRNLLKNSTNVVEVLGANTYGISSMYNMFYECTSLTSVPLFDTSNVTTMYCMFYFCTSLTSVPLYNTSNVTDMRNILNTCWNIQSGALALYQQASSQTTPPTRYGNAFYECGVNTTAGAAELAQIPSDWK